MAYQRTCEDHSKPTEDFGESLKDEYTHNLIGTKHTFIFFFISNYTEHACNVIKEGTKRYQERKRLCEGENLTWKRTFEDKKEQKTKISGQSNFCLWAMKKSKKFLVKSPKNATHIKFETVLKTER